MQRSASSKVSIDMKAKPREARVRGSTTKKHEATYKEKKIGKVISETLKLLKQQEDPNYVKESSHQSSGYNSKDRMDHSPFYFVKDCVLEIPILLPSV